MITIESYTYFFDLADKKIFNAETNILNNTAPKVDHVLISMENSKHACEINRSR